ncbi:MAG TPA: hypothetical protein VLF43_00935, partial [Candidatus Saccharimonadales bacterium]|nr:hypothetical protein [Candidatus Saccharimonadales bacterium]
VSMGTLVKTALSDTATTTTVDYHSLVDVANTGDLITGLSLAKSVLKDYEFFGSTTWPFYFLGVFGFYVLLFGLYIRVERRAKPDDRRRFALALGLFLVLVVLATASYLRADLLIKFLIDLPGGWMFRSPLKWQLYLPIVLCMALAVALKYVRDGWHLKGLYMAFLASLVLMNGYLCLQIYQHLLTPRKVATFAPLLATDMAHKNLLFVDSGECVGYSIEHPNTATELNEVLISKTVQVKHQPAGQADSLNLGQYDFVMGCRGTLDRTLLTEQYAFKLSGSFADNTYQLYENTKPQPYIGAVTQVFTLETATQVGGKYALSARTLHEPFTFVTGNTNNLPTTGLTGMFDDLSPANIKNSTIQNSIRPAENGSQHVVVGEGSPVYMAVRQNTLQFSSVPAPGMTPVTANQPLPITVNAGAPLQVTYQDPAYSYKNTIPNASLENGPWQAKVGDCNNYDSKSNLSMSVNKNTKTDGKQSLELVAKSHIACTGPPEITVTPGGQYLLSFDYQASAGRYAGYNVGFDSTGQTPISERLPDTEGKWMKHTAIINIPAHARQLKFTAYAYPNKATGETGKARYDNFSMQHIPPVVSRFFIVSGQQATTTKAPQVSFIKVNPTKTVMSVTAAKDPFYLTTKESYNPLWKLRLNDSPSGLQGLFAHAHTVGSHTRLNNAMNGWHIDPQTVCAQSSACTRQANGTYNISLVMEFTPQHWFYIGALISLVTAIGTLAVVWYSVRQDTRGRRR